MNDHLEPHGPQPIAPESVSDVITVRGALSVARFGAVLIDGEPIDAAIRNVVLGKGVHEFRGVIDVEIEPR